MIFLVVVGFIIAIIVVLVLALLLWVVTSPMPMVRLLRKGFDAPPDYPEGFEQIKRGVIRHKDRTYPSAYGRNHYDLYVPATPAEYNRCSGRTGGTADGKKLPVIVWVHGGAFVAGSKDGVENWAASLAHRGFAVAAMDYEWAPEAHWPAQVKQIGELCYELIRQSDNDHLDMNRVIIAGDSAGAHMAAQFALVHTSPSFVAASGLEPVLPQGALKAALLYCGPYDISQMAHPKDRMLRFAMSRVGWSYLGRKHWQNSEEARLTTIQDFVTKDFPPCYITDGNAHSFDPQGRALADALEQLGVMVGRRFFDSSAGEVTHEYQFSMSQDNAMLCFNDTLEHLRRCGLYSDIQY